MRMSTLDELKRLSTMTNLPALAEKVLTLQTADKFRLAGLLLDQNKVDLAELVGTRACQELQLVQFFGKKAVDG